MMLEKILRAKKIVCTKISEHNIKKEMLGLAKSLKEKGFKYILFCDNCLFLENIQGGWQDVVYLELSSNKLFLSKYRYKKGYRMVRIFERHRHFLADRLV